jgi:hypothetical protein
VRWGLTDVVFSISSRPILSGVGWDTTSCAPIDVQISANSVSVTLGSLKLTIQRYPRVANYFILNIRDGKPFKRLEVGAQGSKICLKPEGS